MKPNVYIDSSIISYLTARPSRDLIVAANQQLTHTWWEEHRPAYNLYVSQLVMLEISAGDNTAAQERLTVADQLSELDLSDDALGLARQLLDPGPLPQQATRDAIHIAVATVHGMDFLLTWNCRHMANAAIRNDLTAIIHAQGYESPVICTPQELMGD